MKLKIALILAFAAILITSGCTQLNQIREGGENILCMIRGDTECISESYGFPNGGDESNGGNGNGNQKTKTDIGIDITKMELESAVESYNSTGVLEIKNQGGNKSFKARDVDLNLRVLGNVTVYSGENFNLPIEWVYHDSFDVIEPGEEKTVSFDIPSGTDRFDPSSRQEYIECSNTCSLEEKPWSFDSSLTVSYDYKIPIAFPYRVYDKEYYENHVDEVEKDLENYCRIYRGSSSQYLSTEEEYNSPVSLKIYTRSCKIFEGKKFLLNIEAHSERKFKILDDSELISEGCERDSDLSGNKTSPVVWNCDMKAPGGISAGEKFHMIFELPYRVEINKFEGNSFRILKK